jgi:hypothetical protein
MSIDLEIPAVRSARNRFWDIALISATLTAIFHFLPGDRPFGIAFAVFVVSLAVGMVMLAGLAQKPLNRWSFVLLIPALLCALADALYSSPVVQALAFIVSLTSLTFFAFWLTVPQIKFGHIKSLWPVMFIKETLWPVRSLSQALTGIKGDRRLGGVAIGVIVAIPFLLIFISIFSSADQLFSKSFSGLLQGNDFGIYVFKTIRDLIVGIFFLASGSTMLSRLVEERKPADGGSRAAGLDQTVYVTFLALINILFLVFVAFQFAYFFGGQAWVATQGITYADYARQGFFQLLFAAGLVFAITWALYWLTDMRQRWTKVLTMVMIAQTGIIIVSALRRLLLYVEMYGLTLSRWWAAFSIILIGMTLLMVAALALKRMAYGPASKLCFIAVLWICSLMLCFNSESFIAQYNIDRFLSGKSKELDQYYLTRLSVDAMPELVRLAHVQWPVNELYRDYPETQADIRQSYINALKEKRDFLKQNFEKDWLGASLSTHWALNAVDSLE